MRQKQRYQPSVCVLLTACVDPKGCILLERSEPKVRERDYVRALKKWIGRTDYPIIFCENSGYDLSKVRRCTKNALLKNREIEFLQFEGNNSSRDRGKGHGELSILEYAIKHSKLINRYEYVLKITGRIFVKNINSIIEFLDSEKDCFVMHDNQVMKEGKACFESVVFASKPKFIEDYLLKYSDIVDDSKLFYFEHALYQAVDDARKDGFCSLAFSKKPNLEGFFATFNLDYKPALITRIKCRMSF